MGLEFNRNVFITCAVTGSGDTVGRTPHIPVTPKQIAAAAIEAAKAGAAIAHIHVREPDGSPSRRTELYREVVDRIRESDTDVIINLTAGMGGDLILGGVDTPLPPLTKGTDMAGAEERLEHVAALLPEICTLDCGTMNFGLGDYIMTNTTAMLRAMGHRMTELGVRPEIEAFDTGHLWFAKQLVEEGVIEDPVMVQLCMGIGWGAPDDLLTFLAMAKNVPDNWTFSAFSIGRNALAYPAAAVLAGGHIRVGLEDCIWLGKNQPATNGALVERAATIVNAMGGSLMNPAEVRAKLKLKKR